MIILFFISPQCQRLNNTCHVLFRDVLLETPCLNIKSVHTLIARFMRPIWGPSGADRTQVGPMLAPWILLSGYLGAELLLDNELWSLIGNKSTLDWCQDIIQTNNCLIGTFMRIRGQCVTHNDNRSTRYTDIACNTKYHMVFILWDSVLTLILSVLNIYLKQICLHVYIYDRYITSREKKTIHAVNTKPETMALAELTILFNTSVIISVYL